MTKVRQPSDLVRDEVAGAMEGIAAHGLKPFDASTTMVAVSCVGDAVRLGVRVPKALLDLMQQLSLDELGEVVAGALQLLNDAPTSYPDRLSLGRAVEVRDQFQSFEVGLLRLLLPRDVLAKDLPRFAELSAAKKHLDDLLRALVSREDVDRMLGNRRWLLAGSDWTRGFSQSMSTDVQSTTTSSELAADTFLRELEPPDDAVLAYAQLGHNQRWVEGMAQRNDLFREGLRETILALHEEDEDLSLVAWRWFKGAQPFKVATKSVARYAAATTAVEPSVETRVVRLGRLGSIAADANLFVSSKDVVLKVVEIPGTLRSVSLGTVSLDAPESSGEWIIRIPQPVPLTELNFNVVAADGATFEVVLQLS